MHKSFRGRKVNPRLEWPFIFDLGSVQDGVKGEGRPQQPVVTLAECLQIRKTVHAHAGLSGTGIVGLVVGGEMAGIN